MTSNYTQLNALVTANEQRIIEWIEAEYNSQPKPIYTSVDIRNAGFKIAHVDTNLFPSGFNNISAESKPIAVKLFKQYLSTNFPEVKTIALVPENFTRNLKYLQNLLVLKELLQTAGYTVEIGSPYVDEVYVVQELDLPIYPIKKPATKILVNSVDIDLVILNNDLTLGLPDILQNISIPIIPNAELGWHKRRKQNHFHIYNSIADRFSKEFGIDSWDIKTFFTNCEGIDFRHKTGLTAVAEKVEDLIRSIKNKYVEKNISSEPFVFIKSDMGTYGMGIMMVRSGDEVLHINKKHRHTMDVIKHGVHNTSVIIQEGVPTIEKEELHTSETMAYLINGKVFDLVSRINKDRDDSSNLNSHGMYFKGNIATGFNIKTCIALLATLAAAQE